MQRTEIAVMLPAMKKLLAFLFAAAIALPFTSPALAQTPPEGPPPAVRQQLEQLHATARTNAFNALSADHRAKVQSIVDQVNAGTLDRRDAATQIDAILSPDEKTAVLAEGKKMREAMRTYFAQNPPPGGTMGAGPNGPGGQNANRPHRTPSAGRTLLMLGANRMQHRGGTP